MTSSARCAPSAPPLALARLETPLGALLGALETSGRLVRLDFADGRGRPRDLEELAADLGRSGRDGRPDPAPFAPVERALAAYFAGRSAALDSLDVSLGGTPFQRAVWTALRRIPAGETRSYGALAAAIGRPRAVRAVGAANGANVLALVVPCHRVVGADGRLTGYAGGLDRKRTLLELEGAPTPPRP